MSKKADKFLDKYIVGKQDWILKHKEVISKLLDEYETEQCNIPVVSSCNCVGGKIDGLCKECWDKQ
jgi:hypothetical protein